MPVIGLGTFNNLKEDQVTEAVTAALDIGYRFIDCAYIYRSEGAVGKAISRAIADGKVSREDLFIATKLWNTFHEPERVELGIRESLIELGLEYVDLFYMHWPIAFLEQSDDKKAWILNQQTQPANVDFIDTWKAMEGLVDKGLAKAIGISNFNIQQLTRLLQAGIRIQPANMQLESHPLFPNRELVDFCKSNGISVTAYSPLAKGGSVYAGQPTENILEERRVTDIATRLQRTPAQVVLRWAIQRGLAIVPKSCTPARIQENFQIFDFALTDEDMASISTMDINRRIVTLETFKEFPEYPFQT